MGDEVVGTVRDVGREFADEVSGLPQVQQVRLDLQGSTARLWTILRAEPFEWTTRQAVYEAQLRYLQRHPDEEIDFRLINLNEFPDTVTEALLPSPGWIVWDRGAA